MIKPGKYKHYKGGEYEVIGVAKHSETLEELVVYRALYGDRELWVRPRSMFEETVEVEDPSAPARAMHAGGQEGKKVPRFRHCGK